MSALINLNGTDYPLVWDADEDMYRGTLADMHFWVPHAAVDDIFDDEEEDQ